MFRTIVTSPAFGASTRYRRSQHGGAERGQSLVVAQHRRRARTVVDIAPDVGWTTRIARLELDVLKARNPRRPEAEPPSLRRLATGEGRGAAAGSAVGWQTSRGQRLAKNLGRPRGGLVGVG